MKGGANYHLEGLVEVCGAWLEDYFDLARVGGGAKGANCVDGR